MWHIWPRRVARILPLQTPSILRRISESWITGWGRRNSASCCNTSSPTILTTLLRCPGSCTWIWTLSWNMGVRAKRGGAKAPFLTSRDQSRSREGFVLLYQEDQNRARKSLLRTIGPCAVVGLAARGGHKGGCNDHRSYYTLDL